LRPGLEQLEDRTTPSVFGTPTPIVSLQSFSPTQNGLKANLLVTLPGGTQQTASTSATISGLQRIGHGAHARTILNLTLGPVHLDILGVVVDLQPVTIKVQAIPGRGQLLGNLLSNRSLHGQRLINTLASELNTLISAGDRLANLLTPSIPLGSGATLNTQQLSQDLTSAGVTAGTGACPILTLDTGPIDLNLLGLDVSIPTGIHLKVTAIPSGQTVNGDSGGLLGSLLCQLANALNNPSQVAGFLTAADLSNILNGLANPLQSPAASTGPLALTGVSRGLLNTALSPAPGRTPPAAGTPGAPPRAGAPPARPPASAAAGSSAPAVRPPRRAARFGSAPRRRRACTGRPRR
jgi:hypothetical protein